MPSLDGSPGWLPWKDREPNSRRPPPPGLRKPEESIVGLATLLAFHLGPLATVEAAGCLTAPPCKGLSPSSPVTEQHLGFLAATPAMPRRRSAVVTLGGYGGRWCSLFTRGSPAYSTSWPAGSPDGRC